MFFLRSLFIIIWIAFVAAFGAKQAIYKSLIVSKDSTSKTAFLLSSQEGALFLPAKPSWNVLPDLNQKPVTKSYNNRHQDVIIFINSSRAFYFYHQIPTWRFILSLILYPFHYFW